MSKFQKFVQNVSPFSRLWMYGFVTYLVGRFAENHRALWQVGISITVYLVATLVTLVWTDQPYAKDKNIHVKINDVETAESLTALLVYTAEALDNGAAPADVSRILHSAEAKLKEEHR